MSKISVRPLCPELAIKAQVELNETPKKLEDGIIHLKEWIAKQPHLRARTDDQWLASFLRGCKHSLEKTKEKLDLFYTMRSIAPEMTALKFWEPKFKELMTAGIGLILPKRVNPADPRVVIIRVGQYDATMYNPADIFAVSHAAQLVTQLEDDAFTVAGFIMIFDLTGMNSNIFKQITPSIVRKALFHCQEASPMRLKKAYFIGMPSYFKTAFKLGLQFLNEKNKQKMNILTVEELHNYVSLDILPFEYGGNGGTVQEIIDGQIEKYHCYEDYFREDLQYGTDETKRPNRPKTADIFGLDGSFRQLELD